MRRPTIFLMLAVVAAFLAAMVAYSALKEREAEIRQARAQSVEIVVAAREIALGERIAAEAVKLARWPRESVPEGAFTNPAALQGHYANRSFVKDEPIVRRKLVSVEKAPSVMPLIVPPGMRAMSVPVDDVGDIAGFVKPRTRVDVLVAFSGGGPNDKPFSKIVLQNVEVLAIAQQLEKGKDEPELVKVVTLLVTPHEAEKLALASHQGTLRLAMRNYMDDKMVTTMGSDIAEIVGQPVTTPSIRAQAASARARARPARAPFAMHVMRDGKTSETVFFGNDGSLRAVPAPSAGEPRADPPAPAQNGETGYVPVPKTVDLP